MRKAFTLVEVTLALSILGMGVLAIVGLYSYGYRESSQSREDVGATAVADAVLSQLTMAISATNLKWSVFRNLRSYPDDSGWGAYIEPGSGRIRRNPSAQAKQYFNAFMQDLSGAAEGSFDCDTAFPEAALNATRLSCGLVILHDTGSPIVRIGFRAMRQPQALLSMPMFYTEARFMGVDE